MYLPIKSVSISASRLLPTFVNINLQCEDKDSGSDQWVQYAEITKGSREIIWRIVRICNIGILCSLLEEDKGIHRMSYHPLDHLKTINFTFWLREISLQK